MGGDGGTLIDDKFLRVPPLVGERGGGTKSEGAILEQPLMPLNYQIGIIKHM